MTLRNKSDGVAAPIIVTVLFGAADFAWLDGMRRAHFPAERNKLPAHLTLFHHMPPSIAPELERRLAAAARADPPSASAAAIISLGRGVAIRVVAPQLSAIRAHLADAFAGLLTPQDAAPWRPHVTVQNKVEPATANALRAALDRDFRPTPLAITGLAAWAYRGGPWEPLFQHSFRRRRD